MSNKSLEELVAECKEFIELKNKNRVSRNPPVGEAVFLVNKKWWKNYKQYIFYREVKSNTKPVTPAEDRHPGPINNDEELCDDKPTNLKGTGKVE